MFMSTNNLEALIRSKTWQIDYRNAVPIKQNNNICHCINTSKQIWRNSNRDLTKLPEGHIYEPESSINQDNGELKIV